MDSTLGRHRLAVLENELLRISVLASKGTDIVEFLHKPSDTDFMWRAPGDYSSASCTSAAGPIPDGAFLDQYLGGWHEMAPSLGAGHLHGAPVGAGGELTLLPWHFAVEQDDPEEVTVAFSVRLRRLPLRFEKRLRLASGSPALLIEEQVTNESEQAVRFSWGHHAVLGPAFLNPACRIECPGGRVVSAGPGGPGGAIEPGTTGDWPQLEGRAGQSLDLSVVREYAPGWEEDVYLPEVADGWVGVTDSENGLGFGLAWQTDVFRTLWLWENYGGRFDYPWYGGTYCLALEFLSNPWEAAEDLERHVGLSLSAGERLRACHCATVYAPSGRIAGITRDGAVKFRPR